MITKLNLNQHLIRHFFILFSSSNIILRSIFLFDFGVEMSALFFGVLFILILTCLKKWVGFCTLQHKQDILNNQYLCSDVIISAQNLLLIQFPNINGFHFNQNSVFVLPVYFTQLEFKRCVDF
jgi:hypothetical protein